MKKKAFTLAEVLITLGIIGVVAALTLPSLIQNYQKKALETSTKKFYSMMSQAVRQYMSDEGVDDLRNTPLDDNCDNADNWEKCVYQKRANFVTKYLKVVKICGENEKCFAESYKKLGSSEDMDYNAWYPQYILADGSIVTFEDADDNAGPIGIFVDVNGKKGPNKNGYDLWSMSIFYDGSIDESELTPVLGILEIILLKFVKIVLNFVKMERLMGLVVSVTS